MAGFLSVNVGDGKEQGVSDEFHKDMELGNFICGGSSRWVQTKKVNPPALDLSRDFRVVITRRPCKAPDIVHRRRAQRRSEHVPRRIPPPSSAYGGRRELIRHETICK
nr:hypothetical protein Iba_chr14aCG1860 [Ipomoea batatas]